jgi:hypothetical protein
MAKNPDLSPLPYTYPECGHTKRLIKKNRDKQPQRCWDCIQAERQEQWRPVPALAREARPEAAELIAQLARRFLLADCPEPLAWEYRNYFTKFMQGALGAEKAGAKQGAVADVRSRMGAAAKTLMPDIGECAAAAQRDGVLRIMDQAHWAAGWLYELTGKPMRPVPDGLAAGRGRTAGLGPSRDRRHRRV